MTEATLVILSPGFPGDEEETSCLPAQQLFVKALNRQFPSLQIVVLSFQYPFHRDDYHWHGNRIISFNGRNRGKWQRLKVWWQVWRQLQKLGKAHRIIGLYSFWCTECALIGKYSGKVYNIPHYNWILGQDAKKENRYVRLIRPQPEMLVAMSQFLADTFQKDHGIRPAHIIPNGIDASLFQPGRGKARDIDIMGAGSLIPLKQYNIFLRVAAGLKSHITGLRAVLCGDGPEADALKEQLQELQLSNCIRMAGEVPHPQVIQLMQGSRIFLHTSRHEGFSTVCLEALYAGAHVISFCNPGMKPSPKWHVVKDETEMLHVALALLQDPHTDYSSECLYTMDDSALAVMQLFAQSSQQR